MQARPWPCLQVPLQSIYVTTGPAYATFDNAAQLVLPTGALSQYLLTSVYWVAGSESTIATEVCSDGGNNPEIPPSTAVMPVYMDQ